MKRQILSLALLFMAVTAYPFLLTDNAKAKGHTGRERSEGRNISSESDRASTSYSKAEAKAIIKECTSALRENPKDAELYFRRANALLALKDYYDAVEDLNMGLRYNSTNAEAYYNRAIAKMNMSDYHGATSDFSRAIRNNPGDKEAYYNRAWCNIHNLKTQAAIQDFNNIIRLDPEDADAYYNRGNLRYELKDFKGACADWNKAAPTHSEAAKVLKQSCK